MLLCRWKPSSSATMTICTTTWRRSANACVRPFSRYASFSTCNSGCECQIRPDNVYGTLRRHEINITTRATYSFTRDMTLEAYLQTFVAVGNYFDIRKLARQIGPWHHRAPVGVCARQHAVCRLEP